MEKVKPDAFAHKNIHTGRTPTHTHTHRVYQSGPLCVRAVSQAMSHGLLCIETLCPLCCAHLIIIARQSVCYCHFARLELPNDDDDDECKCYLSGCVCVCVCMREVACSRICLCCIGLTCTYNATPICSHKNLYMIIWCAAPAAPSVFHFDILFLCCSGFFFFFSARCLAFSPHSAYEV